MSILRAARASGLPDWCVGAGAVRNAVWDHLSGYARRTPAADVNVAFFGPYDLSRERDREARMRLQAALPSVPWEATNQAAVHTCDHEYFGCKVPQLSSVAPSIPRLRLNPLPENVPESTN